MSHKCKKCRAPKVVVNPFLTQGQWFMNAVDGSDSNTGLTPDKPLASFAELTRRLGVYNTLRPVGDVLSIFVQTDMLPDDPFNLLAILGPNVVVKIFGTVTNTAPGIIGTVVPKFNAGDPNQPWEVQDVTASWGPESRIGLSSGAYAWGAADFGGGNLRTSDWSIPDPNSFSVVPVIVSTEPYSIQVLTKISLGAVQLDGTTTSTGAGYGFFLQDLEFYDGAIVEPPNDINCIFTGCKIVPFLALDNTSTFFLNCDLGPNAPSQFYGGEMVLAGGISFRFFAPVSGALKLEADFMFQGVHIEARGGTSLQIGQACVFDSPEHGLHIHASCDVACVASDYGTPRLWGVNNANAVGIGVSAGAAFRLGPSVLPTITGGLGDIGLNLANTARAWDEGAGAYTAPYAIGGAPGTGWSNFDTSPGRNAQNVEAQAAVLTVRD